MVKNIVQTLEQGVDPDTLTIEFPRVLDQLRGEDTHFCIEKHVPLQSVTLHYQHNIAKHTTAYIFVNKGCETYQDCF